MAKNPFILPQTIVGTGTSYNDIGIDTLGIREKLDEYEKSQIDPLKVNILKSKTPIFDKAFESKGKDIYSTDTKVVDNTDKPSTLTNLMNNLSNLYNNIRQPKVESINTESPKVETPSTEVAKKANPYATEKQQIENAKLPQYGKMLFDASNALNEMWREPSTGLQAPELQFTPTPSMVDRMKNQGKLSIDSSIAKAQRSLEERGIVGAGLLADRLKAEAELNNQIALMELERQSKDILRFDETANKQALLELEIEKANAEQQMKENAISGDVYSKSMENIYNRMTEIQRLNNIYKAVGGNESVKNTAQAISQAGLTIEDYKKSGKKLYDENHNEVTLNN